MTPPTAGGDDPADGPKASPAGQDSAGTAPPGRDIGWPLLLVLAALAAVAPVATDLYLPGFPAIGAELGADASGVQLTLTSFLIGMAVGQLVTGPLSDRYGRRTPLIVSVAVCVAAGVACALAPTLPLLVAARLVQGLAGAGGMVIGRAVITDLAAGRAAARAFTLMMTVGGVAPVLAPSVGGLLAGPAGWRGMLWAVALSSLALLVAVIAVVAESRVPAGPDPSWAAAVRTVAGSRGYRAPVTVFAFSFAVMMAYIAASPFLYQNVVGLSELGYGVLFGVNAAGLIGAGAVAGRLAHRVDPVRMIRWCLAGQVVATMSFLVLAVAGAPVGTFPVAVLVAVAANGGILGNAAALAMSQVREVAGTGSAVLGFSQFALGAAVSPLVGLGGANSAVVPAAVMAAASLLAGTAALRLRADGGLSRVDASGPRLE